MNLPSWTTLRGFGVVAVVAALLLSACGAQGTGKSASASGTAKHHHKTTKTKKTPKKPAQLPPQTFAAKPVSIGEEMLGSYWTQGKLHYDGTYYSLLFTVPKGTELRAPFAGTVRLAPSGSASASNGVVVFPASNLFMKGAGNSVFYGGNSLKLVTSDNQSVSAGQVIAVVEDPTVSVKLSGISLNGNIVVGYGATTPNEPNTYTYVSAMVLEEAFPYVKGLLPLQ